jgi:zinc protease
MKRVLLSLLAITAGCAHGPAVATQATAGPPVRGEDVGPLVDGDVTDATVRGVRVIIKRVPGAEFVAARLTLRGGARNWDASTAGVEMLAIAVATRGGTESLDKDAFARRLAALGASIGGATDEDASVVSAKSPRAAWGETFALLSDALLHPALPPAELEVQRQAQLSRLRREQEFPDARLRVLAHHALYRGHPYDQRAVGTPDNVARFDVAALRAHLARLRETSRMVLVIVGDFDAAQVSAELERVGRHLGGLPRGAYQDQPLAAPHFDHASLTGDERKLPTNYILSLFAGPGWRDPAFIPAVVAMNLLAEREWDEVRTKRNLSYAPSAGFRTPSFPSGFLYVTAVDPGATMKVMLTEARRLGSERVPQKELAAATSVFLTHFLMASESTDGQAELLGRMLLLGGDWRRVRSFPAEVRAVTPAAIQAFAGAWMANWQTVVVGNAALLDPAQFETR